MANFNQIEFYDKVYGCWIGKSIGGTLGTPFEGRQELLDVRDFTSPAGQPLPNDDLDLQLVWLRALEDRGALGINEQVLGEYWLNFIPPHWNEYGVGKSNMKAGLLPPLSGNYENGWKHSNGAWIRSEIWACCAPGCPDIATRYAWFDACVDHGTGEGTYAELFTAAVESAAFVESDRDRLINIGLSYIPAECRVARSINIARDSYARGLEWQEARRLVLEDSADLGWFQAPANVAYFVIGWLYGEGDYKKSLLIAVSCGDDTDCTGGTLGSILGIIAGAQSLPADWKKHIGDDIITVAIDRGSLSRIPPTCAALTERVIRMTRQVLAAWQTPVSLSGEPTDLTGLGGDALMASEKYLRRLTSMSGALVFDFVHTRVAVDYPDGIDVCPGQEKTIQLTLKNQMPDPRHLNISYYLPDGFERVEGCSHVCLQHQTLVSSGELTLTVVVRAGQEIPNPCRGVIQLVAEGRPTVGLLPLLFFGK
ncbi:MAG TPA: ADP-ribosylglycohydrolase family protein [Clostridiales bacterium]|nr:ADP-ribosylglycohydrolase family protein [Clostridiales bacterium]